MKVCMVHSDRGGIKSYSEFLKGEIPGCKTFIWYVGSMFQRLLSPFKNFKKLKEILNENDIVHVQYHFGEYLFFFLPLLFLIKRKAKLVLTLHEDYSNLPFFVRWFHLLFYSVADLLIVHTQVHKDKLNIYNKKCVVIPHGIVDRKIKREQNKSGLVILPGFINSWKGCHILLEAIKLGGLDDFKFKIIGKANERYLRKLKKYDLPNVEIIDSFLSKEEFYKLLDECEFAVLPYTRITASGMLAELMSYDIPTVLSDLDYFMDVTDNVGFYFKSGDVEQLNKRLRIFRLFKEDVSSLFAFLVNRYSWSKIGKTTLEEYQKL